VTKKAKKNKKDKPLYDENGKWVDQDSRILSGIRRAYRLSPQMQETLNAARVELPPAKLKNGKPGKRVRVRFKCAVCGELFSSKNVQVDHISPATPIGITIKSMTWDDVVKGIFCGVDNLQVLCSTPMIRNGGLPSCHAKKSAEENWIRKALDKRYPDGELEERWECGLVEYDDIEGDVEIYRKKFKEYLQDKAIKLAEKEARKVARELKKNERQRQANTRANRKNTK
jgi:ribosomal protein L44E